MSSRPSEDRLREVFNIVERYVEEKYQIPVIIKDVPHPFTGDLDGAEIHVDYEEEVDGAVFILAHLFGHTVQWNVCDHSRAVGQQGILVNPTSEQMKELGEYEVTACRYSLQLFHECGIRDLDQWLSNFAACDYAYLEHVYKTGEKPPFMSFWREESPLIDPLKIPDFEPKRWVSRWEGIVV